jgi:uncharacterized protein
MVLGMSYLKMTELTQQTLDSSILTWDRSDRLELIVDPGQRSYNRYPCDALHALARTKSMRHRAIAVLLVLSSMTLAQSAIESTKPHAVSHSQFLRKLAVAAIERTHHAVRYEPAYVRIPYPNGDVSPDTGVCTDEVIRSYRSLGVDLQKEVHEDMVQNFSAYPHKWTWLLPRPDSNIDHRRVPNLMVFFQRHGESLAITQRATDYQPGELVTWDLGGGVPHIGIVVDQKGTDGRYMIVHNIGRGPRMEDVLFQWKITGHYRYYGPG